MGESEGYKPDLVGKRVRHNCDDPDCSLKGVVVDVIPNPVKSLNKEPLEWWVVVKFDPNDDLSLNYDPNQPFPINMIKVIEDK